MKNAQKSFQKEVVGYWSIYSVNWFETVETILPTVNAELLDCYYVQKYCITGFYINSDEWMIYILIIGL